SGEEHRPATRLTREQLEELWTALGDTDAGKGYQALCTLRARTAQAVALLQVCLLPALNPDAPELPRLLADLDDGRFAVRQSAEQALAKLGTKAEAGLRLALGRNPPLHVRKSLEGLLDKLDGPVTDPERLRELRAIEVLEHIGSPAARRVLERLAQGVQDAR